MNKTKITFLCFLILLIYVKHVFGDAKNLEGIENVAELTAEIRSDENGKILVDKTHPKSFQFVLVAGSKQISVFDGHNMWNYSSRSFTAEDEIDRKLKYKFFRFQVGWNSNFPITTKIIPSGNLIEEIDFCDGTWSVDPPLSEGQDHHLLLKGHYDVENPNIDSIVLEDVSIGTIDEPWFGHLETNVIKMVIKKNSVNCFRTKSTTYPNPFSLYKNH
jgi:hypothetical protein